MNTIQIIPAPPRRFVQLVPVACSLIGAVCLFIGSSAPSTRGLSGHAFSDAFEVNEDVMFWPVPGFVFAVLGLVLGSTLYRRTWGGWIAVGIAVFAATGFFLRQ